MCALSLAFLETTLTCRADMEHQVQGASSFSSHLVSPPFEDPDTRRGVDVNVSSFSRAVSDFQAAPQKRGAEHSAGVGRLYSQATEEEFSN